MIPRQVLTLVSYGCIYTSYASRHCRTKGATPKSRPHLASAWFVTLPSCSTTREGMFPVLPSGVSLYQAGAAVKCPPPRQPSQDRLHCQTAILAGQPTPPLFCSHATYVERHRQSLPDRDARSRTEAWLTSGQPGHCARFSGNISSIAYTTPSSSKPTKSWSPTSGGPHTNPRR
jgi:hypothetical protein